MVRDRARVRVRIKGREDKYKTSISYTRTHMSNHRGEVGLWTTFGRHRRLDHVHVYRHTRISPSRVV